MELTDFFDADLTDEAAVETLKEVSVPPCPEIIAELLEEARREDIDFIRISRLITGDVALAAAVLKSANSPFFALRRKVQSVQQAVAVLGLRNLLKIVYGVVLKQSLGGPGAPLQRPRLPGGQRRRLLRREQIRHLRPALRQECGRPARRRTCRHRRDEE